jgi:hypothetical protein
VVGKIKGYFGETMATLEGIKKKDRSDVMHSTSVKSEITNKTDDATGQETIEIKMTPEQKRPPVHVKHVAMIQAALKRGMRALKMPRIGGFRVTDLDFYEPDSSDTSLSDRLNRTMAAGTAIEDRKLGYALVKSIADEFAKRDNVVNENADAEPGTSSGRSRGRESKSRGRRMGGC